MSRIARVKRNGLGYRYKLYPGDEITAINGYPVRDVFDYRYLINDEHVTLTVKTPTHERTVNIRKDETDDLGLEFDSGLMDEARHCHNKCVFCFIDQLPKGMRSTLYFKDDDARLSFLTGNYITLTNLSDDDLDRIIFYHLSPINISVHAANPEVRVCMLKNPRAADLLPRLQKLYDAGISMNFQAVLCRGINDGAVLEHTIETLSGFLPYGQSLSVVPAGLTKFRAGLHELRLFSPDDAADVLRVVKKYQRQFLADFCTRFVFAADEFYLTAGHALPEKEEYEEFHQLENGVGMLSLFWDEINESLKAGAGKNPPPAVVSVVTGTAAASFMNTVCNLIGRKFPQLKLRVFPVVNEFFGETITVSGLLTGRDIINQLKGKDLGERLLIPSNAFRDEGTAARSVFLDDISLHDVSRELSTRAECVTATGKGLLAALNLI
jgi:putative radical SAM enzyme (TIGR03279 family)